jgi:hypothetical protein
MTDYINNGDTINNQSNDYDVSTNLVKLLNYINDFPNTISDTLTNRNTKIVSFNPYETTNYKVVDNKKCYAPFTEYSNATINMTSDGHLYTPEQCMMNAAIKQQQFNSDFINNIAVNSPTPGLNAKVIHGYFADDTNFFKNAPSSSIINTGIINDTSNIQSITQNYVIDRVYRAGNWFDDNTHLFSVELDGYFVPNITGNWTFTLNSDDASYLWIGDKAINTYNVSNADINNGGLHPPVTKSYTSTVPFIQGEVYKIRIQYGENYGFHNLTFSITDPNGKVTNGTNYLYTNIKEKNIAYYALVENSQQDTDSGNYKCYVTDTTIPNIRDELQNTNNGFSLVTVWQAFDPAYESIVIKGDNYLTNDGKNLVICDGNNNKIKILSSDVSNNHISFTNSTGDLVTSSEYNITKNDKFDSQVNPSFLRAYYKTLNSTAITDPNANKVLNTINVGDKILCLPDVLGKLNDEDIYKYIRLTNDGKFLLFLDEGNLKILTNAHACSLKNSENLIYTTKASKSFYPYSVDIPGKTMNLSNTSYIMSNNQYFPITQDDMETYGSTNSYVKTSNIAPPGLTNNTIENDIQSNNCNDICNSISNCNYYYSYRTDDGKNYCRLDKNNSVPVLSSIQPFSGVKSSDLYVKQTSINFNNVVDPMKKSIYNNIRMQKLSDKSVLNKYTLNQNLSFDKIYKDVTTYYTQAIYLVNQLLHGNMNNTSLNKKLNNLLEKIEKKESFMNMNIEKFSNMSNNKREGFDNGSGVPKPTKYNPGILPENNAVTNMGLVNSTIYKKILPLEHKANIHSRIENNITNQYNNINQKLNNINNLQQELLQDDMYDYSGNLLQGNRYDNSGNSMTFNKKNPSLQDVIVEDSMNLMYRENTFYILATITASVLIIAAISVAR